MRRLLLSVMPLVFVAVVGQSPQLCDVVPRIVLPTEPIQLALTVPRAVSSSSAVVVSLRPLPYIGPTTFSTVSLRMTYTLRGQPLTASSDMYGIAELPGPIDAGTILNITLSNDGHDGPKPVELISYSTPDAACGILIDDRDPFAAPLPPVLSSVTGAPPLFLMAVAPPNGRGFTVETSSPDLRLLYGRDITSAALVESLSIGREIPWSARLLYIKVLPAGSFTTVHRITIAWSSGTPSPGIAPPSAPTPMRSSILGTALWATLLLLVVYMVVRSAYNYRVGGVHEFPAFVPHHGQLYKGFDAARRFTEHMSQRGTVRPQGTEQGYSDVNEPRE